MSTVPAAPPIKYVLGYRSRTLTLNPNPNPKINKKQNDTGMKLNIELYLKVDFIGTGVSLQKAYNRNGRRNTYGYSRLLVVLLQVRLGSQKVPQKRNFGDCWCGNFLYTAVRPTVSEHWRYFVSSCNVYEQVEQSMFVFGYRMLLRTTEQTT